MPIFDRNPEDPSKRYWTNKPAVSIENKKKEIPGFGKLPLDIQQDLLTRWANEASGEVTVTTTSEVLVAMTALIDDCNFRSKSTYDARKEAIIYQLKGKKTDDEIESVRKDVGHSAPALKAVITDENERPLDGITKDTINYLDDLIEKGKADAKARRDKAAANKATKSGS